MKTSIRQKFVLAIGIGASLLAVGIAEQMQPSLPIKTRMDARLGYSVVTAAGMSLYTFAKDATGVSNCVGACATNWPPLLTNDGDNLAETGISDIGTFKRSDGGTQVMYKGRPLYTWSKDTKSGDTTGQGFLGAWFIANVQPTLSITNGLLVGANKLTVYVFDKDTAGTSNCEAACLANWPALTVSQQTDLVAPAGGMGKFSSIKRSNGDFQVTYNDRPLYYFGKDQKPGDAMGDQFANLWHVVKF
jgi:predicted lipoprotein with Yx(FWY)xxD motif